jgi:dihydroxyacetone kinase DhaKLM complex PTS-EIIA-like component DhaM
MVSLVLVGHSDALVTALVDVVRDVTVAPPACFAAGGTDDGRMGTSLGRVRAALDGALAADADGCLVLYDTGSAWLTIGIALDELPATRRGRVEISDGPFVEGALAAAARAADGAPLHEVAAAAAAALTGDKRPRDASAIVARRLA